MSAQLVSAMSKKLLAELPRLDEYANYYSGNHRLAFATEKFQDAFGDLFGAFAYNYCALACDAAANKVRVSSFSSDDPAVAEAAYRLWKEQVGGQENATFRASLVFGNGYLIADPKNGSVVAESPRQITVARNPANPSEITAALKMWKDTDEHAVAILYEPDMISTWRSSEKMHATGTQLDKIEWNKTGEEANSLGRVPLYVLPNQPDTALRGRSLLKNLIPIQDAINKLGTDMIIASEFQAFRQRVLIGIDVPKNPETGQPLPSQELEAAISRLWVFENPDATVWESTPVDLGNYRTGLATLIGTLCSIGFVPPTHVQAATQQTLSNLSGEAIQALSESHISYVEQLQQLYARPICDAVKLALNLGDDVRLDVEFDEVSRPSWAAAGDLAVKEMSVGVPMKYIWRRLGYSTTEIAEMQAEWDRRVKPPPTSGGSFA